MIEYSICTLFIGIFVWYALIGGSVNDTGSGGYWETEAIDVTGRLVDEHSANPVAAPGLVQALHKKQEDFRSSIYQP
jgi:hypothetical protein